uniref:Uncharacterized protein n=1 Tax=Babesia bovis TaxID=5865 RepID=S6C8A1_BABBO|nr:hypothetical protein [Babesia bovis]
MANHRVCAGIVLRPRPSISYLVYRASNSSPQTSYKPRHSSGHISVQSPLGLNTLHKQVGNPQSIEQITGASFLSTVVLAQVQKVHNVSMPWLKVDSEGTFTLATTLVNITSSGVEYT